MDDETGPAFQDNMIGQRIGSFRLDEEIGRGGMGAVYRATRVDGEFDQTVAVKLIKRGMDTDMILSRFRRERQILASLNHPNIAYFLGGGSTDDGRPYFVMEYVDGLPIYKFCNSRKLSVRARLEVFRQVCWAVAAAHGRRVVHRDLKPSNILVKFDGKPKLLDFGIAKVLDPAAGATVDQPTATEMRVMTPEYASPEQISGEPVGPESDIYSLGVLLYELLTGHRPYKLQFRSADEIARAIREELPTAPSGSITRPGDLVPDNGGEMTLERVFAARNASPEQLRREFSGDLDKILLKALRKKPDDRYRSAVEFADDITNYLDGRPVRAELPITLSGGPNTSERRKPSVAILPFKVFRSAEPDTTGGDFVGLGMADALISRISGVGRLVVRPTTSILRFEDVPAAAAAAELGVSHVLDGTVRLIGDRIRVTVQLYDAARDTTAWARAIDKEVSDVLEVEDSIAAEVAAQLMPQLTSEERSRIERRGTNIPEAYAAYMRGRYQWSRFTEEGLRRSVEEFERSIQLDPNYALPYLGLADYYAWAAIFGEIPSRDAFPKAQEAARKALEIDESLGEAYSIFAFSLLLFDWNFKDAEVFAKRAIELSPNNPFAHECYSNFLVSQGRFDEGIAEILKAEELDPVSPRAILMTAWTLYQARRFEESEEKARKAQMMQKEFPQGDLHLGNTLIHTGKLAEAVEVLRHSAEGWRGSGMPRYMLAFARAAQGDETSVRTILNKLLESEAEAYVKPYFIAMAFVATGDHDKAFEYFQKAVDERNEWLIWFATDPKLDPIRDDPRYLQILRQVGNPIVDRGVMRADDHPSTAGRERSIAVLPFKLVSRDSSQTQDAYLSLGLADAVTMRLSNVRKFLVRPTSSVLPYMDRECDAVVCGRELGVEFVVDGIIRRVGNSIRVTAQLLDVGENSTRWSASFLEEMNDVLELEDSISEQVTRSLLPKLSDTEQSGVTKRGTDDPGAHDAYLQGRYFWNQFTPESLARSLEAYSRAIRIDPDYALAYAGICDYYTWAGIYGLLSPWQTHPKVFEAARKALELDGALAEAHAALGLYHSNQQEWQESESCYRRAIELNPNYALAHEWLSALLVGTGRFEEGSSEISLAEDLDPVSLRPKVLSAWTIYQTRHYARALEKAKELERMDPTFMQTSLQTANILLETGDAVSALRYARRAAEAEPDSPLPLYILCFALAANGLRDEALSHIVRWEARADERYVAPYFLGLARIAVGDFDAGIRYLEEAHEERSAWTIWFGTEPKLDVVKDLPRFEKLLRSTNNPLSERAAER